MEEMEDFPEEMTITETTPESSITETISSAATLIKPITEQTAKIRHITISADHVDKAHPNTVTVSTDTDYLKADEDDTISGSGITDFLFHSIDHINAENEEEKEAIEKIYSHASTHTTNRESIQGRPSVGYNLKSARPSTGSKLTPFYLNWSYGANNKIGCLNLTSKDRHVVFYAAAHIGVLYDYESHDMRFLQGHQNAITSISVDKEGKWIVTSDSGEDNVVIVWDSENCLPIRTLFNCHGQYAPDGIGFSLDSKYLITVGNEPHPIIKFWLWTLGKDEPDDEIKLSSHYGTVVAIRFNESHSGQFIITFEKIVVFAEWIDEKDLEMKGIENDEVEEKESKLEIHVPDFTIKGKYIICDSTFVTNSYTIFSGTSNGYVIFWGNNIYTTPYSPELNMSFRKEYVKMVQVSKHSINVIRNINGIIAIGDGGGRVKFYDNEMKVLYWIQKSHFDAIKSLSFNRNKTNFDTPSQTQNVSEVQSRGRRSKKHSKDIGIATFFDNNSSEEELNTLRRNTYESKIELDTLDPPSDATLERKPFNASDFIVFTTTGVLAYYHFLENKVDFFTIASEAPVQALAAHPKKHVVIIGNAVGRLTSFDTITHTVIAISVLPEQKEVVEEKTRCKPHSITSLGIGILGGHLICGTKCGKIFVLDATTLQPRFEQPIDQTDEEIVKICFSPCENFMAYYDKGFKICLHRYQSASGSWTMIGKVRAHYKPINDILFGLEADPLRLFSIGQDRVLVEYAVTKSKKGEELIKVTSTNRVEQTAIPKCAVWSPETSETGVDYILAADDQFKFKFYNPCTGMIHGTILAPTFGNQQISMMEVLRVNDLHGSQHFILFGSEKVIGIQLFPPDGNPYKFVGMIGHPVKLTHMAIGFDGKYLFTVGKKDNCFFQWLIQPKAVSRMAKLGGVGLEPYYCLIDGGQDGWLYSEMKDLFYYMQILHQGENTAAPRVVSTKIPLYELSDLMCACGFYPTEFESENMLVDIKHHGYLTTAEAAEDIEFEDFVKLYINHKPAFGINLQTLRQAFQFFVKEDSEKKVPSISRAEFLDLLCYRGVCMSPQIVKKYLGVLLHYNKDTKSDVDEQILTESNFRFVPKDIDYDTFLQELLGIDMKNIVSPDQEFNEHLTETEESVTAGDEKVSFELDRERSGIVVQISQLP